MVGVPFPPQILNLGDRDSRSSRNSMSFTPGPNIGLVPERQNGGAEVVNIVPCHLRRNRKMHPEILLYDRAIDDVNIDVFHLPAKPGVDHRVPTHQGGDSTTTPNARRPPTLVALLNPRSCWGEGERVDHPRLTNMGMQYDAVAFGQTVESPFDFVDWRCQRGRDLMPGWRKACPAQSVDESMMDFRIKLGGVHSDDLPSSALAIYMNHLRPYLSVTSRI